MDIIKRAHKLFDKIYVTVFDNTSKKTLFTAAERLEILRRACAGMEKIVVDATSELLADYAVSKNAGFIIRGVRNSVDYEYEYDLFRINKKIGNNVDTLLFPSNADNSYISAAFVREMIKYNRDISDFVPEEARGLIIGYHKEKLFGT